MRLSLLFLTRFGVRPLGLLLLLGTSLLAQAQTIRYVKPAATGAGDGSNWANASGNLQAMINASTPNNQVWVAAGTYKPTTTTDRYISFSMKMGVAIYGGFMGNETTLGARGAVNPITGSPSSTTLSGEIGNPTSTTDNSYHVIHNTDELTNTAILDGFVITGGNADGDSKSGGGMRNVVKVDRSDGLDNFKTNSPLIRNCLFQANSAASYGGAISNESSDPESSVIECNPTLINCSFQANSAGVKGGAIANETFHGKASPKLINCSFKANSASEGGAMSSFSYRVFAQSSPTLTNCSFESNSAVIGGAMHNRATSNFQSGEGGGNCDPTLINCSFLNNRATTGAVNNASGGAMSNDADIYSHCIPRLTNCSFQGNLALGGAGTRGGAISNSGTQDRNCGTFLINCVLFGNGGDKTFYSADNNRYTFVFASYTVLDASVINYVDDGGNTRVTASPFANVTTVALAANSPAINTSNPQTTTATVGATDLAGNPRIVGCKLDMGALEFQYTYLPLAINAQPATSSVVCAGKAISVPVGVSGTVQEYQWYKDSFANPVAGQTTATLTLSNPQTGDAGSYSLVVTSTCNALTTTAFSLSVNSLPPVSISPGSATLCQGKSVLLTASGASTYTWSDNKTGNTLSATTAGTYSVTGVDGNGCANTATATVTENKPPVSISPGSATLCQGKSALLTASGASTYTWSDNTTGNTLSTTTTGTYSVTGVADNGCSNTATATVTENKPPVSISPGSVSICQGKSALLTASGASTYTWSDNTTGNTLSTTTTGTYSVTGVADNGCSNTATATVTVNAVPSLTITASPSATSTQGNSVTLTLSVTGATSFTWSTGSTSSSIVVSPTTSTPYSVMARNGAGCVVSTSLTITVTLPLCGPVIYVTQPGAGLRDGSSWDNALGDNQLQIAIDAAANCGGNGQVWVATGVYKPTTGSDRNASFALRNGVALYGGFAGTETALTDRPAINPVGGPGGASQPSSTTLSGNIGTVGNSNDNSFHVLNNPTGLTTTAVLDGFVITGGAGGTQGGGMLNDGSSPTIRKCSFVGNSASAPGTTNTNQGGAMANTNSSSPQLTNCVFQSNLVAGGFTTNQGGAMANTNGSSPQLTNCVFQSNSATGSSTNPNFSKLGGAMANTNSNPKLINCAFLSNSASGSGNNLGGAMYNNVGNPQLTNCSFLGNSAGPGRAVYNISSSPKLINCVVFGNGGGSTFANSGSSSIPSSIGATFSLFDNTVTGYSSDPTNLTASTSPFASSNSVALAANSPAIDAGLNSASGLSGISTDLAGNPRLVGCKVDMGALEFQGSTNQTFAITGGPATTSVVCAGTAISVPVSVSGTVTSYQWYRDSFANPVAGQTSATLALTNVQPGDGGSYSLVVTGACNSLTSTAFSLTVNSAPTVAAAGISQTITTGAGATLAANTPTLGTGNWSVVSGPSVDLAQFSNVNNPAAVFTPAGGGGSYDLVWTIANAPCTPSGSSLTITVIQANTPPVATVNTNQTATVGTAFSYTVKAFTDEQTPNSLTYSASISPANGFSFNPATRVISGTPATTGLSSVTITATDPGSLSASTSFSIMVNPAPVTALTLVATANPTTILTTGTTTLSATVSGGTMPYSYVFAGPGTITPNGNTASVSNVPAGVQTFTVTATDATTPTSQTILATASVSVTPQVSMTVIDASASEAGSDGATFRISIDQATSTPISVSYTLDGTASAADYTPTLTGSATIQTGNTYVDVVITPVDDARVEGSETIRLQLVSITGDPLGNPSSATATITDNDVAYLTVDPTTATISEGDGTHVSNVRLRLLTLPATGGSMAQSTTVTMGSTNLSTAPADFSLLTTTLVFPANAVDNATQSFSVAIVDDNLAEGVEFFDITILSAASSSGTPLIPNNDVYPFAGGPRRSRQTVRILDNDVPVLTVSGNGQTIVNGDTNPSVANNTDFGSVVLSDTRSQSFVIASTGTASLTVTSLTLTGVADFSLVNPPVLPLVLAVGNSQTISVGFTPTTAGLRSTTLGINTKNTVNNNTESTYTAALQGTGADCSLTASIGGGLTVCAGQATNLTASGGMDYIWNTGATTATISATAGTYSVTVLSGICSATTAVTVISIANPIVAISGNLTICAGQSTTLTATAGASYVWSNTQTSPSISVSAAGPYSVTVTAASGCSNTGTASVTVNALPVITLTSSGTVTCANPTVTLTAGGGTSYTFSAGASQIGGSTENTATVTAGGTYTVTVANANGCTSTTSTTVSGTTDPPAATLLASSTAVCAPAAITLTAGTTGVTGYTFSAGATQIGTSNQAIITQTGTYSVAVSNASGCTATASTSVTVNPPPSAPTLTGLSRTVSANNTPLPLGQFVSAPGTLSFSGVSGAIDNPPTANISTGGVQNFQVTQTDANGCTSGATPFSITVLPSTPVGQTVCRSSLVVLRAITTGVRYEWYKNGQSAPFKLTEIASIQRGTATSSLTLVSIQTTASYYCKVFQANGTFTFDGPLKVTVDYSCIAPGARLAAHAVAATEVAEVPLSVVLIPNPVVDGQLKAVVRGATGQALSVELLDLNGQVVRSQHWPVAAGEQVIEWNIIVQPAGLYLLRAQTAGQRSTAKVMHH